jgi:hypothetical protein
MEAALMIVLVLALSFAAVLFAALLVIEVLAHRDTKRHLAVAEATFRASCAFHNLGGFIGGEFGEMLVKTSHEELARHLVATRSRYKGVVGYTVN